MIQIANMVLRQGEKDPFVRNVFTLQSCAPIVGSQVLSFPKEEELLKVSGGFWGCSFKAARWDGAGNKAGQRSAGADVWVGGTWLVWQVPM